MPFKSQAQRRWMYATHPKMAREWEVVTPKGDRLPSYSAGQHQKGHTAEDDYKHLTPGSYARFPGRSSEREATREAGVTDEPQSFGAKSRHKGLRARDVRAAAAARAKKG